MASETEKKYVGYGYHGGGRKKTGVKRQCFSVSCSPEEMSQIKKLVDESGKSISRFILDIVLGENEL